MTKIISQVALVGLSKEGLPLVGTPRGRSLVPCKNKRRNLGNRKKNRRSLMRKKIKRSMKKQKIK